MNKQFIYETCCVNSTAEKIQDMVDNAIEITYRTFSKYVDIKSIEQQFGYGNYLRLKNDYHVSFHRSKYDGRLCYYMRHSGIEYIYTKQ